MLIEDNTIDGAGGDGITAGWQSAPGHDSLIPCSDITGTNADDSTEEPPAE